MHPGLPGLLQKLDTPTILHSALKLLATLFERRRDVEGRETGFTLPDERIIGPKQAC